MVATTTSITQSTSHYAVPVADRGLEHWAQSHALHDQCVEQGFAKYASSSIGIIPTEVKLNSGIKKTSVRLFIGSTIAWQKSSSSILDGWYVYLKSLMFSARRGASTNVLKGRASPGIWHLPKIHLNYMIAILLWYWCKERKINRSL